ncbi:MAG: ABC transporter permease [Nitrospiraceae bacterium]|nr:ABC transporter permease [Nitrospiraceae bacterium]
MTITSLAIKNLKRHRVRTLLTILGVAIAAATLFSILSFDVGYRKSLHEEVSNTGIHLFVSTEGCPLEAASLIIHGGEIPKFLQMERLKEVKSVEGVKQAGGFLIFSLPTPDGSKVDLFYGISDDVPKLKPNWKIRGSWFKDENSIVLGSEVARVEKRDVGDKIYIESLNKEFNVVGILERTYGQDDGFYYLPLTAAQKYFRKEGKLTAIGVQLFDVSQLQSVKNKLETLPDVYVVPAEDMSKRILELIGGTKALMYSVLLVALMVSGLGLLNTILMATFERQKEFGYIRCVGAQPFEVMKLVILETLMICLLGIVLGIAGGLGLSVSIEQWIRQFLPYIPAGRLLRPNVFVVLITVGATLALGVIAGLYPSYRAGKISPMEAIRNE